MRPGDLYYGAGGKFTLPTSFLARDDANKQLHLFEAMLHEQVEAKSEFMPGVRMFIFEPEAWKGQSVVHCRLEVEHRSDAHIVFNGVMIFRNNANGLIAAYYRIRSLLQALRCDDAHARWAELVCMSFDDIRCALYEAEVVDGSEAMADVMIQAAYRDSESLCSRRVDEIIELEKEDWDGDIEWALFVPPPFRRDAVTLADWDWRKHGINEEEVSDE